MITGTTLPTRLDRGMYTAPIWWGLLLTGIYVVSTPGTNYPGIPEPVDSAAASVLLLGALACLTGTRIPDDRIRLAYRLELFGLVLIVLVLGWLAVAGQFSVWQQFTLAGGLVAVIQIGSIRLAVRLAISLHRRRDGWPF